MEKMVSVIVPVYNTEAYLRRCVMSIVEQTCQDFEIILVDDGSTDASGEICDRFGSEYDNITVIHKKNGGLMSAWKEGVKAAKTPFLCFIDSDDWVDPLMLHEMMKHISGEGGEIICCNHVVERLNGTEMKGSPVIMGYPPGSYDRQHLTQKLFPEVLGHENRKISMSRCMKLISSGLIRDNLHYLDERIKMGEDMNIMLPAILDAKRIVILRDACYYHYFFHNRSMVHQYDSGLLMNIELLKDVILRVLKDKKISRGEAQGTKEYLFLMMLVVKNEIRGNPKGCYAAIKSIFSEDDVKKALREYPLTVGSRANRLIYGVMKRPDRFRIFFLRLAIKLYDRR